MLFTQGTADSDIKQPIDVVVDTHTHTHNHFSVPTYLHICHRLQDIQLKRPGTYGGREGKRKSKEGRCKDAGCTDEWPGSGPIVFRVTSLFLSEPFRGLSSPAGGVLHKHDSLSTQKKSILSDFLSDLRRSWIIVCILNSKGWH